MIFLTLRKKRIESKLHFLRFVVMILLAEMLLCPPSRALSQDNHTRLAIMPFENLTGHNDMRWLGEAIQDSLTTELNANNALLIIDRSQLHDVTAEQGLTQTPIVDYSNYIKAGKLVSAHFIIIGSYQIFSNDIIQINARIIEVDNASVKQFTKVQGNFNNLFDLFDELAKTILDWINIKPSQEDIQHMIGVPKRNIKYLESISRAREAFYSGRTDEADELIRKTLLLDPSNPVAIILQGDLQVQKKEYETAVKNYILASEIYKNKNEQRNYSELLSGIGSAYMYQHRYNEALTYYNQSLEIGKIIRDEYLTFYALWGIGIAYDHKGRYDEALDYYRKSLEIGTKIGEDRYVAEIFMNTGNVYSSKKQYVEALEYYNKSLEIGRKIGDEQVIAKTLCSIGVLFLNQGRYDEAWEYFIKSLEISTKIGEDDTTARTLLNMGSVYYYKRNYLCALEYFNKSLEISRKSRDEQDIAHLLKFIGICYAKTNRFDDAKLAWKEASEHYRKIGDEENACIMRQWLAHPHSLIFHSLYENKCNNTD